MTPSLMGRLFIAPAVIVCVLLALAVVIVLFGTTSLESKQESIADLLAHIESDTGDRTLGIMLMPKSRESWQAAQELARRFEQRDKFLKPEEIEPAATKIIAALDRFPAGQDTDASGPMQQYFLMIALARLQTPTAVPELTKFLKDPSPWTKKTALGALAMMHGMPEAQAALPEVLPLLNDRHEDVQVVACAAVASLGKPGDATAIKALADKLESDREVQWNVAMALARLGSPSGKMVLLNMLDRKYWERQELSYEENGSAVRRKYAETEVSRNLSSAVEASAFLADTVLKSHIEELLKDKSVEVRNAARAALARMDGSKTANRGVLHFAQGPSHKVEV